MDGRSIARNAERASGRCPPPLDNPGQLAHAFSRQAVILEGAAPRWDKLRLRGPDGQRTISAEDLSQLPLPAVGQSLDIAHEPGPMGM